MTFAYISKILTYNYKQLHTWYTTLLKDTTFNEIVTTVTFI